MENIWRQIVTWTIDDEDHWQIDSSGVLFDFV